jgi:hypothetical protein
MRIQGTYENEEGEEVRVYIHVTSLNDLVHADGDSNVFVEDENGDQWSERKENITFDRVI